MHPQRIAVIVAAAVVFVGGLLPWLQAPLDSISMVEITLERGAMTDFVFIGLFALCALLAAVGGPNRLTLTTGQRIAAFLFGALLLVVVGATAADTLAHIEAADNPYLRLGVGAYAMGAGGLGIVIAALAAPTARRFAATDPRFASRVASDLTGLLQFHPWFKGVAIERDSDGLCLWIGVDPATPLDQANRLAAAAPVPPYARVKLRHVGSAS